MEAGPNHPSTLTTCVVVVQKKPPKKKKISIFSNHSFPIVHSEKKYFLVVALRAPQNAVSIFFCRCDPTYIGMISYLCNVYSQIRIAQAVALCS